MSLIDQLVSEHGTEVAEQISSTLGVPKEKAEGLLPAIAPMILGGLQRQAQDHGGAERVDHILDKHADENIFDNLGGFFSEKAEEEAPDPGLGGLLGDAGGQATEVIGNQLGVTKDMAMKVLPILAPIILGFLLKQRNQAGGGSQGQGLIMGWIDKDGDGSILDDVAGLLGGGGGGLGALLGGGQPAPPPQPAPSSGGGILSKIMGIFGKK